MVLAVGAAVKATGPLGPHFGYRFCVCCCCCCWLLLLLLRFLLLLLLLLLALLFERPAVALGCRAGERGGRVAADEVVAKFFQVGKKVGDALLQDGRIQEVVSWHCKGNRGEARYSFKERLEVTEIGFPLTAPCQTLARQQE